MSVPQAGTPSSNGDTPLLEVTNLRKFFPVKRGILSHVVGHVKAVHDVSFSVGEGQTLGLVGESGCGKTTVGRSILRLIEPTAGSVKFRGKELTGLAGEDLRPFRREMQIIFQDPYSSLNPRMTVEQIVGEGALIHNLAKTASDRRTLVMDLLKRVGLQPESADRYPHEFSGGQRQRIGIARALAVDPSFIVCDEAVSALDVSVQAQIINLLIDLQAERGISYLFIAHDLSVVEHISSHVAVMYLGHIVEFARTEELFRNPRHPYTRKLLSAIPKRTPDEEKVREILGGEPPSPLNPPPGCPFEPRCPIAKPDCRDALPPEQPEGAEGHVVRCPYTADLDVKQSASPAAS